MDRSLGFGSTPSDWRPVRTRFLYASPIWLTSPLNVRRWPIIQKVRRHPLRGSDCLYACGFRICFTPLPGFFSPFPHGTGSLSVDHEYLALEDGPPIFRQDFTCPALLVVHLVLPRCFRLQGYHLLWPHFPERSTNNEDKEYRLVPFRSPLLWESRLISFPAVT